ncbi:MAG: metallophosphoesterase, partial [Proteobacteria bacterium]|nr:metallophosphoesterase [Pseudomonadota bacterium]
IGAGFGHALFGYGLLAAAAHTSARARPRVRGRGFQLAVSLPAQTFLATGFLCGAWFLALALPRAVLALTGWDAGLAALRWLDWVPLGIGAAALVTSLRQRLETVRIRLGDAGPERVERVPHARYRGRAPDLSGPRPLRIAQIADPHLGPWQTVEKLRRRAASLVAQEPDLVALTGDFLTMESHDAAEALARALEPLRELRGRCFAVFGNHDLEAPDAISDALRANHVELLIDAEKRVRTEAGAVQVVGANHVWRDRERHLGELLARFPRVPSHLRLLLLHDPSAFAHVAPGEVDLTLSGHTHGGQLGLLSLGLPWTVLSRTRWPDHGLFARGAGRLYVHRGTGFYGFPLRVGVPGEHSILEVFRAEPAGGGEATAFAH